MSEAEREQPRISRRGFLKLIGLGSAAVVTEIAAGKLITDIGNEGGGKEPSQGITTKSNTSTPEQTVLTSPTPLQAEIPPVTPSPPEQTVLTSPTPLQAEIPPVTPSPPEQTVQTSPTPDLTELPLNPTVEDIVNSKELPYKLHSYEVFEKGKDTQYFTFILGVDEEMYTRSQGCDDIYKDNGKCDSIDKIVPNPDAFPGLPEDELKKKVGSNLEQFYLRVFLQNLKFSYPDKYKNIDITQFEKLLQQKEVDPLTLPHTLKNKSVATVSPGQVDINKAPIMGLIFTALPVQFYPNNYFMGYGNRVLGMQDNPDNGALILEINKPDAYLLKSSPDGADVTSSGNIFTVGLVAANVPGQRGDDRTDKILMPESSITNVHGLVDRLGTIPSKDLLFPPPAKMPLFKIISG